MMIVVGGPRILICLIEGPRMMYLMLDVASVRYLGFLYFIYILIA